jgi:hypothetical protein
MACQAYSFTYVKENWLKCKGILLITCETAASRGDGEADIDSPKNGIFFVGADPRVPPVLRAHTRVRPYSPPSFDWNLV